MHRSHLHQWKDPSDHAAEGVGYVKHMEGWALSGMGFSSADKGQV